MMISLRTCLIAAAGAVLCGTSAGLARAQTNHPAPPVPPPITNATAWAEIAGAFTPATGSYEYKVQWKGMTAGRAVITVAQEGTNFVVTSRAGTDNLVRHVLDSSYTGHALVGAGLVPLDISERRSIRDRQVVTRSIFDDRGGVDLTKLRARTGRPNKRKELRLEAIGDAVDPFTAVLRARAVPWQAGLVAAFDLLIGEDRYALTLTCTGSTRIEMDGKNVPVWRLRPSLRVLGDDGGAADPEDEEDRADTVKAVSQTRLYLSKDEQRNILRLVSQTRVGDFDVVLSRQRPLKPAPGAPPAAPEPAADSSAASRMPADRS